MNPDLMILLLAPDGTRSTAAVSRFVQDAQPAWDETFWYVFADPQVELHPELAALLHRYGVERPDVDIVYGDEVIAAAPGRPLQHLCKPDFDRTQLIAQDYIGLPIAVRGRAMAALGGLDASAASAQVYDLLLRAMATGLEIGRITQVLAVNRPDAVLATVPDRLTALRRTLIQSHAGDVVPGLTTSSVEFRRRFDDPPHVTILVLAGRGSTPGRAAMFPKLLESLRQTDWPMERLHVVTGDDAVAPDMEQRWPFDVRLAAMTHCPSQASRFNRLWRTSQTEQLVFLADDLLAHGPGWLRALMTFAVDQGIGGVGARLRRSDGAVRHAGMPHAFAGLPADAATYQNWAVVQREWSIVSGEAFATRRSLLEQVNGLDERFGFGNGHADLCLRLRLLGFRIVYTPHAELTQQDGASRNDGESEPDETALFLEKWQNFMADDPAYHPRLARNTPPIAPVPSDADWWRQRPNSRLSRPCRAGGDGDSGGFQPE